MIEINRHEKGQITLPPVDDDDAGSAFSPIAAAVGADETVTAGCCEGTSDGMSDR